MALSVFPIPAVAISAISVAGIVSITAIVSVAPAVVAPWRVIPAPAVIVVRAPVVNGRGRCDRIGANQRRLVVYVHRLRLVYRVVGGFVVRVARHSGTSGQPCA
jgi:hypothetical protein